MGRLFYVCYALQVLTFAPNRTFAIKHHMAVPGAGLQTGSAADAFCQNEREFGLPCHGLGIVAPGAPQGAPFQEHRGSDARSVVDRESLNVEDQSLVPYNSCQSVLRQRYIRCAITVRPAFRATNAQNSRYNHRCEPPNRDTAPDAVLLPAGAHDPPR